jgi:hypothetical protein
VDKCGLCGSEDLKLGAHIAQKKFKYVTIKCRKCYATLNFGQQTENPNIFYLKLKESPDGKPLKGEYDWKKFEKQQ